MQTRARYCKYNKFLKHHEVTKYETDYRREILQKPM